MAWVFDAKEEKKQKKKKLTVTKFFSLLQKKSNQMELSRSSPEFQQLEYKLKVQLSSTTLRVTRCHQLSDVTRAYNYEKTCQGIVAVESWMDAIEVFETDRFADIQKILPVVDLSKITFPVGPKPVIQGKMPKTLKISLILQQHFSL